MTTEEFISKNNFSKFDIEQIRFAESVINKYKEDRRLSIILSNKIIVVLSGSKDKIQCDFNNRQLGDLSITDSFTGK